MGVCLFFDLDKKIILAIPKREGATSLKAAFGIEIGSCAIVVQSTSLCSSKLYYSAGASKYRHVQRAKHLESLQSNEIQG